MSDNEANNEEQGKLHDKEAFTVMELTEIQKYLEDTWENSANTLNGLSITATDLREQAVLAVLLAQHRASVRLIQYITKLLEGKPAEGDPDG